MSDIKNDVIAGMDKGIENFKGQLARVRTGRANANILDSVKVDYYGALTPVSQLAAIKTPEAHLLVVEPWDKTSLGAIEKAINASDLGVNPSNDGNVVRIPFPAPTEERRRALAKDCSKLAEEARVAIRNTRRDGNNKADRLAKEGEISEDDARREQAAIQKMTDEYIAKVEEILKKKEAEVMEI